ncbi:MAG: zinc ribbon domain-containing protein [Treponema sp.]|jgi:putative FmdB family regulatory protein|nr:zinc ribbon domain-containing protein [Treponema sp.]
MPTYEYECKSCGHTFEAFQSMSDDPLKNCPECGEDIRRLIHGGTGVIFKGSGFYVTDKSKGASTAGEKQTTDSASPAPATAAKSESAPPKTGSTEAAKPAAKTA